MVNLQMPYLERCVRDELKGIPGAEISVDQESSGPPTEPPVNIEIQGDDFDKLVKDCCWIKELFRCCTDSWYRMN